MKATWQLDKGEKLTGEFRKIHRGEFKTVKPNPDTKKFVAKAAKRGPQNRKKVARLEGRMRDYSNTVAGKPGYHRPGSMQ